MKDGKLSYKEPVRRAYERIKGDGITNVWDRFAEQSRDENPNKIDPLCQAEVRCDLCLNGPCKLQVEKDKRGVCGITGDGMAMRMMLLRSVLGASSYQVHTEETVRTMRYASEDGGIFKIKENQKLRNFARRFGIPDILSDEEIALQLCNYFERDFLRKYYEESYTVLSLAPKERIEPWRKLGILPGGIHGEMMFSAGSCCTNVDGNYLTLAMKALRLSIAVGYQCQIVNEYLQDVIFGIPYPHRMQINLGVLDPDYVNILPSGQEPFLGFALIEVARKDKWQKISRKAGAKGIRIIGNIKTGQEISQRWRMDNVFYGFAGNWIMQEAIFATGAVDLFAYDMNCLMSIAPIYAERYKFKLVPCSPLISFEGIKERIEYSPYEAEKQAELLIEMAIDNFYKRKNSVEPLKDLPRTEAIVGFSPESICEIFGGDGSGLVRFLRSGNIKGIAGLISCTSLRYDGQDVHTVKLAEELIKNDILVFSMGCGNVALQIAGLCSLDAKNIAGEGLRKICKSLKIPPVLSFGTCSDMGRFADFLSFLSFVFDCPISALPVIFVATECMGQKITVNAIFSLALGLFTYLHPVPMTTGAPNLKRLLTEGIKDITGGKLLVEKEYKGATEAMLAHVNEKRKILKLT